MRFRRLCRAAWSATLLATAIVRPVAAGAADGPARPATRSDTVIVGNGKPAGFDALLEPQAAVVDVYVGGRAVGEARIVYRPGKVTLVDVDAVVALLPDLVDPAPVRAALGAPDLDAHAELVCALGEEEDGAPCATLRPALAGVIFDERHFRLDIVVAPRLLAVHPVAPRAYLPPPSAALSLVDQVGASIAGSGDVANYGISNRAIVALGEARVRNDLFYSSAYGLSVDALVAELDRPGLRYSAGAMWIPGIDLIGRRRLLGAGVQSQVDTRADRAVIAGTPLVVSLGARSRVDILRDGRLLSSRSYDPGNQTLDTASLPDGTYEVVLHIQEAGGGQRDERRFFTRNAAIAAVGEPIFFAYAGLLAEDRRDAPLATSGTPFYTAGLARRVGPRLALDATVMGTDRTALIELGGYWLSRSSQLRVAALASVRGDAGLLFQAYSSGTTKLNYTLDARRVWSRNDRPLIPLGDEAQRRFDVVSIDRVAQFSVGSFGQVNAAISYNLKAAQIGVTAAFRDDPRIGRSYAIGPSVFWPVVERGGVQVNLRGDLTVSNRGTTALVGLSVQRLRGRSALFATAGARTTSGTGQGGGAEIVGSVGGSWQRDGVLGGNAGIAAGIEREVGGTLVRGRADINAARGSLFADVAQPIGGANGSTQYSVNFQTSAAVSGGSIAFQGRDQQGSAILVAVAAEAGGAVRGTPFEVLVDNSVRGTVRAGSSVSLPVPAYRQYAVRLRAIGPEIMQIDGSAKQVTVYPGTVGRVSWTPRRVVAMFGRLIWPDGSAVANASVNAGGSIGGTDPAGWFQIEAAPGTSLTVRTAEGFACDVALPGADAPQGYAALGTLICPRAGPVVRYATAQR